MNNVNQEEQTDQDDGQYLTFNLAAQSYALDVLNVREIRSWNPPTPLPQAAPEVLGAMNLRGAIIPVIDLRKLLGVAEATYDATTGVVVVQSTIQERERQMGLVVDQVLNVTRLNDIAEDDADRDATNVAGGFVSGLSRSEDDLVILLDLQAIMTASLEDEPAQLQPGTPA